jgi:hypothetical protein
MVGGPPIGLGVDVSLNLHVGVQNDLVGEMESVAVSPGTLVKAIAAWDRGEEYLHGDLEF